MNEQWQELKKTITEMRDNNGTGTQQEVCKFLVNYMEILEKQMQEPTPNDDYFRRMAGVVISQLRTDRDRLEDKLAELEQEQKTGHWIYDRTRDWDGECKYECSCCGMGSDVDYAYCMRCGAKMVEPQESEDRK